MDQDVTLADLVILFRRMLSELDAMQNQLRRIELRLALAPLPRSDAR